MKAKELKNMEEKNLRNKMKDLQHELMLQRAQAATGTAMKSPGQIKQLKKSVARIKTVLNKKEEKKV